jgi:hypothetical protein
MSDVRDEIAPPSGDGQPESPAASPGHAPLPAASQAGGELVAADDALIGRAFAWSLIVLGVLGIAIGGTIWWLKRPRPIAISEHEAPARVLPPAIVDMSVPKVPLTDITRPAGLDFEHYTGARGEKLLPETMGAGCAFLDFDNDGDQDVLLVNSCDWPWTEAPANPAPTARLYRNDGTGQFADATSGSGLDITLYGQGVAIGDYDNDGWVDVYLTGVDHEPGDGVGGNRLFHNEQGKFVDVTAAAGAAGAPGNWSTSASFLDYDNDGDLDLFVCNYILWTRERDLEIGFTLDGQLRAYGRPNEFDGTFPYLFRNEGQGTFAEVGELAGLHVRVENAVQKPLAKSLGVAPIDYDRDGWIDLIVANDTVQNLLFHNRRDGTFEEVGRRAGIALTNDGSARGAMGIDAAYFRNDNLSLAVAIGNFSNEMTALYVMQDRSLRFVDQALSTGLGPPTRLQLTFGVAWLDFDMDGRLDLVEANGHLEDEINRVQAGQFHAQPPVLFWNAGLDHAVEFLRAEPHRCGPDLSEPMVGRGASVGDIDGDGDQDILLTSNGGAPRLLRNDRTSSSNWLRLKLVGRQSNRDAIGAWVEVHVGGQVLRRQVMPTRGYLSQSELPVTVALGQYNSAERVVVRWPSGTEQELANVTLNEPTVVEEAP